MTTVPLGRSYTISSDTQTTTMNTTTITWHPYPQEKPPKANYYLISHKSKYVEIDAWSGEHWNFLPPSYILAWAELPKPYEEK